MTTFKRSIQACGLSQTEAAEYLGVSIQSVKGWCSGKWIPKSGVWKMLAVLHQDIQDCSEYGAHVLETDGIDDQAFSEIESDHEGSKLPNKSTREIAGAKSLLIYLAEKD